MGVIEYDPKLLAFDPVQIDLPKRLNANHIIVEVQINIFFQANLKGVGLIICITTVRQQPAFDPLYRAGIARTDAPWLARFLDNVPKLDTTKSVPQVNLKPALFGIAGALNNDGDSVDLSGKRPVHKSRHLACVQQRSLAPT